jgi:transposase
LLIFGLLNSKAREIRHLNRDAPTVIENARESYRSELVRDIAILVHQKMLEAKNNCGEDPACLQRALDHFRRLHREARRRNEHVGLTAYTLVIIYLRAELIGRECEPARAAIEGFLDEWRHALEEGEENQEASC